MFKIIKYESTNGLTKNLNYCIYDSDEMSKETAIKRIKTGKATRNLILIRNSRYGGIIEKMVRCANSYLEEKGETEDEDIS